MNETQTPNTMQKMDYYNLLLNHLKNKHNNPYYLLSPTYTKRDLKARCKKEGLI